jgi:hypothetical protein
MTEGPGTIGRTLAGKRLDAYVAALSDRKIRRRVYRVCAQIDRDFITAMRSEDGAKGEWYRGFLYQWWNSAEFVRRFPRKRQAELRELLEDYSDSLFQEDYQPETSTQLSLLRAQKRTVEDAWRGEMRRREESVKYSSSAMLGVFALWVLTDSTFMRICLWVLFTVNIINMTELDEVARRRPATLVDPSDLDAATPPHAEGCAKPQPSEPLYKGRCENTDDQRISGTFTALTY